MVEGRCRGRRVFIHRRAQAESAFISRTHRYCRLPNMSLCKATCILHLVSCILSLTRHDLRFETYEIPAYKQLLSSSPGTGRYKGNSSEQAVPVDIILAFTSLSPTFYSRSYCVLCFRLETCKSSREPVTPILVVLGFGHSFGAQDVSLVD